MYNDKEYFTKENGEWRVYNPDTLKSRPLGTPSQAVLENLQRMQVLKYGRTGDRVSL